ncbi:MAG: succinate dehydrogenase flavoprotein subunit, partial [Parachlamydiaceae bacterium]
VDWPASNDPDRMERFRQMTNIRGCFNVGESDFEYHGANRLGANSLLSCIYSGLVVGNEIPRYLETVENKVSSQDFDRAIKKEEELRHEIMTREGDENVFRLHDELSNWLVNNVTVKRNNMDLARTLDKINEIEERSKRAAVGDSSMFANKSFIFANQFGPMLDIAKVITKGALLRNESRGAHYKDEFPKRDDENWLKTTIATFNKSGDPDISYIPVDLRYLKPIQRDYSQAKKVKPHLENIPDNIKLPI